MASMVRFSTSRLMEAKASTRAKRAVLACTGSTVICGEDGENLVCSSANLMDAEVCDGVDNDCDAQIGEGLLAPEA